jgi:hypothetical protein
MGFQKFGEGQVTETDEQQMQKTASRRPGEWTVEDQRELQKENDDADGEQ